MKDRDAKIVTTRKEHKCAGCYRTFPSGTKLLKWDFLDVSDNSGYCTWYICPVCDKFSDTHDCADYDGTLYEGFAIEPDRQEWERFRAEIESEVNNG